MTVSYTHLDVYKRQELLLFKFVYPLIQRNLNLVISNRARNDKSHIYLRTPALLIIATSSPKPANFVGSFIANQCLR